MMKISTTNRVLLLGAVILSAYQIVIGIDNLSTAPIIAYTIAFGVLLVAALLLLLLGFHAWDAAVVVIGATMIPLALALGLVWEHFAALRIPALILTLGGFLAVTLTRLRPAASKTAMLVLALTHGMAGVIIFLLPIALALQGVTRPLFSLVGLGGAVIGLGGLALSFFKVGKPIIPQETLYKILPGLLFFMTLCFVIGFKYG
jgi:hypothetical protein